MATMRSAVSATRELLRIAYRDPEHVSERLTLYASDRRQILRTIAIALSVLVPIGFVAYADHVRQSTGVNWLGALGALAALSLVLATVVVAGRR